MPAPHNPRLLRASGAHALLGITVLFGGAAARGAAACAWTVPCTGAVASSGAGVGALRARAPHKKPAVPLAAGLVRRVRWGTVTRSVGASSEGRRKGANDLWSPPAPARGPSAQDVELIERELGYVPTNLVSVAHRLADGTPAVIEHACLHACMNAVNAHIRTCMHARTHTHTHTHTRTQVIECYPLVQSKRTPFGCMPFPTLFWLVSKRLQVCVYV